MSGERELVDYFFQNGYKASQDLMYMIKDWSNQRIDYQSGDFFVIETIIYPMSH